MASSDRRLRKSNLALYLGIEDCQKMRCYRRRGQNEVLRLGGMDAGAGLGVGERERVRVGLGLGLRLGLGSGRRLGPGLGLGGWMLAMERCWKSFGIARLLDTPAWEITIQNANTLQSGTRGSARCDETGRASERGTEVTLAGPVTVGKGPDAP